MLMRHMNSTLVYTLFCFGHERRLAVTSFADGVVGLIVMLMLVPVARPVRRGARIARSRVSGQPAEQFLRLARWHARRRCRHWWRR